MVGASTVTKSQVTQRLAAILAADVAGYSRLMQGDEQATVVQLDDSRQVFRDRVSANQGRIESMAGDAVLAVFDTAIGAMQAAVEIQQALSEKGALLPEDRKMRFRIGLHLGDVIEKPDGTVYGDGVNIAARLEGLAEPGGIAVSSMVHDGIGRRLDAGFEYLGEHVVKNIADPVRAYRVLASGKGSRQTSETQADSDHLPSQIVFRSRLIEEVLRQANAVAASDATVLIEGESGVGKELIARHIHQQSRRQNGPFVKIDCAAIPPDLFESEFFGRSADAAAGIGRELVGRLESANRGTLFLDHVSDVPAEVQAKLLRPLQDATFERVGDGRARHADVRYIAATTSDLVDQAAKGSFRRDLYFRLSVFPIKVPPLRARPEDVPVLFDHFVAEHNGTNANLTKTQLAYLQKYDWPGNVRELANLVERAMILSGSGPLRLEEALPSTSISYPARAPLPEAQTPARGFYSAAEFEELERNNLISALEAAGWQISGSGGAASALGLSASKLRSRMKTLHIDRPAAASLYVRLGGNRGIATFARDLFGRAVAHPELGRFWRGRSTYGVLREEKLLVSYLSSAAGGPAHYVGRDMKSAHEHLEIMESDWEIFRTILRTTLDALSVPEEERREVIDFAESLKNEVVST